jgi:hypothetical protein
MHEVEKEAAEVTRRIGRVGKTSKVIEHKMMSASNTLSGQRAVDRAVEVLRRVSVNLNK